MFQIKLILHIKLKILNQLLEGGGAELCAFAYGAEMFKSGPAYKTLSPKRAPFQIGIG
jgi:hypothetical protein